ELGFSSQKGSGGRNGVKEKNKDVAAKEGVSPSVTDEIVLKEKQSSFADTSIPAAEMDRLSSLDDTTFFGSFLPLSTPVTTTAGNAPSKSSYANVIGKPSWKKLNIRTLFTPGKWHPDEKLLKEDVSTIPVWVKLHGVPVTTFSDDGLSAIATKLGVRVVRFLDMSMWNVQRISVLVRISNSADKGANNVSSSNTLIDKKIDKIEEQIYEGKLRFVDDDGNPLVPMGIVESDSEVKVVFDETVNIRISTSGKDRTGNGYGTDSLLKQ
nr:hypothetical protein [Tanacetum cinerariifolium]